MTNLAKLTFALFVFTLLFTACSDNDDSAPANVAKEITGDELLDYIIVEEYKAKPEHTNEYGNHSYLLTTSFYYDKENTPYWVRQLVWDDKADKYLNPANNDLTYDPKTGITTSKTIFGYYELTRNEAGEIIVKDNKQKFYEDNSWNTKMNSQYLQLWKIKEISENSLQFGGIDVVGYYSFGFRGQLDEKWRYKADAPPTDNELTWDYSGSDDENAWIGQDGGVAQYHNLFIYIPKGIGWKGNHKDKNLLLVNTGNDQKIIGDLMICEQF